MNDTVVKAVVKSQYQGALAMLRQTIISCPESSWDIPETVNRFWQVAYHVLFYTHLYVQPTQTDFAPWEQHREHHQNLGQLPAQPDGGQIIIEAYSKEDIIAYLDFCTDEVVRTVDTLTLDGESGFHWLSFSKLEVQFYNIRHIQQHTGEMSTMLMIRDNIEIDWVRDGAG